MAIPSPLLDVQRARGAHFAEWLGVSLPDNFGDVAHEFAAAKAAAGVFDTGFRAIFEFTGPDRVRYLNAITSGNIRDLKDGEGCRGLLLNPQGHILAELLTLCLPESLLALSYASARVQAAATLEKFIIMDDVTLADRSDSLATFAIEGPATKQILHGDFGVKLADLPPFGHWEVRRDSGAFRVICNSFFGEAGAEIVCPNSHAPALWQEFVQAAEAHGGAAIGCAGLNALRLQAGVPWFGVDFGEKTIPHEAGLENSHISYTKGCYTGQEIVERVRSRGHVNRRLIRLAVHSGSVPLAGTPLRASGKEVGAITSAALIPGTDEIWALAMVRREFHSSESVLEWDGGTATPLK